MGIEDLETFIEDWHVFFVKFGFGDVLCLMFFARESSSGPVYYNGDEAWTLPLDILRSTWPVAIVPGHQIERHHDRIQGAQLCPGVDLGRMGLWVTAGWFQPPDTLVRWVFLIPGNGFFYRRSVNKPPHEFSHLTRS